MCLFIFNLHWAGQIPVPHVAGGHNVYVLTTDNGKVITVAQNVSNLQLVLQREEHREYPIVQNLISQLQLRPGQVHVNADPEFWQAMA